MYMHVQYFVHKADINFIIYFITCSCPTTIAVATSRIIIAACSWLHRFSCSASTQNQFITLIILPPIRGYKKYTVNYSFIEQIPYAPTFETHD